MRQRSSRKHRKAKEEEEAITGGSFAAVCIVTILVAGLAFALSFDMMLEAAKHYGWNDKLAILFPLIIDVGAIGGTFMGAISANRVYRSIGHQVLTVTLAASVLFNLVGHDLKDDERDALPEKEGTAALPDEWAWTGFVAAVMIPALLAYFVHAFSKALKTYVEHRKTDPSSIPAADEPVGTSATVSQAGQPVINSHIPGSEPAPAAPKPRRSSRPSTPASSPKPGPKKQKKSASVSELRPEMARQWSDENGGATASQVRAHFQEQGCRVPDVRTVRRWLNQRPQ